MKLSLLVMFPLCMGMIGCRATFQQNDPVEPHYVPVKMTAAEWADEAAAITALDTRLSKEVAQLHKNMQRWTADGFTSQETDAIGQALFRYSIARNALVERIASNRGAKLNTSTSVAETRAFLTAFAAACILRKHSSAFIEGFSSKPLFQELALSAKLNEYYHAYDLDSGTFDAIFYAVTNTDNTKSLDYAMLMLEQQLRVSQSTVNTMSDTEPAVDALIQLTNQRYLEGASLTRKILGQKSLLLPDLANQMRHNLLSVGIRHTVDEFMDDAYSFQGWLYNSVSGIKTPGVGPIDFNPRQMRLIKSLLQPGDLILTYTAGYMSNVFLPGSFKHGITYVGTAAQRREANIASALPGPFSKTRCKAIRNDLKVAVLETGYDADVIEAVAEGVIFNSLDYLLKTHVNRFVVLRPRITEKERNEALATVFALKGSIYDFDFDFEDTSNQCCTEVIYRAFNGKGNIRFKLIRRMAVKTLSADDIIQYHLSSKPSTFDLILMAEENEESPIHGAKILQGDVAAKRLQELMKP